MMKTSDAINGALTNPKHRFPKSGHQPKKSLQHRYERRKGREYLRLGDWLTQDPLDETRASERRALVAHRSPERA